ncbi:MAG TPA: hypothetical protein VGK91_07665 [Candidatus Udaeobacter sp.]
MKSNGIIACAVAAVCCGAYFFGRSFERSHGSMIAAAVNPTDNFGGLVYRDIAKISFAALYETLRSASAQERVGWLQEIERFSEGPRKIAALCGYLRALAQIDPVQAGDLVVQLKRHRSPAMETVISAALPSAMPQLVKMLLKLPPEVRTYGLTDHLGIAIEEWAKIDPQAVAKFLDAHKELRTQEYSRALLRTWAGIDVKAAWIWLQQHLNNASPFDQEAWLTGWFSSDPEGAVSYAISHVNDANLSDAITSLAPELFQHDEQKAKQFIERLPTAELRQGALTKIADLASPLSQNEWSPPSAATFIVQFAPAEWPKNFSNVMARWRDTAVAELVAWIAQLSPQLQTSIIDLFPAPSSFEPEEDFLPLLQLGGSNVRSRLLQQMVKQLGSEIQLSPKQAVARLKLSREQKAELAVLLAEGD